MEQQIKLTKQEKNHWNLKINNVDLGVWEKSELRLLIQKVDNKID